MMQYGLGIWIRLKNGNNQAWIQISLISCSIVFLVIQITNQSSALELLGTIVKVFFDSNSIINGNIMFFPISPILGLIGKSLIWTFWRYHFPIWKNMTILFLGIFSVFMIHIRSISN